MTARSPLRYIGVVLAQVLLVIVSVAIYFAAPASAQIIDTSNKVHPDELRKRAGKGEIEAMWMLQNNQIRYKNPKKKKEPEQYFNLTKEERLKWIHAGSDAGDPYSQEKLARIFGKGTSSAGGYGYDDFSALVPIDYAESARLARAAAAGFRQHKAEFRYSGINGGEELEKRAQGLEFFAQQSDDLAVLIPYAEAGDRDAIWGVYLVHAVANNYPDIWDWLGKSIEAGDPRAIVETWRRYSWQSDYKAWVNGKPNDWLFMAARVGDADAMNSMGNAYAWHTQDYSTAQEWYRKAYEAGSPLAEVGMYLYGDATAMRHFQAAEAGDGAAAYLLAQYYLNGEWDGRNTGEYERWMLKAVQLRHSEALWEWGMRTGDTNMIRSAASEGHTAAIAEVAGIDLRAAIEVQQFKDERAAEERLQAESVYAVLRGGRDYDRNGIGEQQLYAALQAAQNDSERELIRAESERRVSAYNAAVSASSGYRPMQVTPYVPQTAYKTESDFRQEHREYKEQLVARLREVTR